MHALLSAAALSLLFLAAVFQIVALVKIWLAFGHEGETSLGVVRGWLHRFAAELDRAGQRVGALVLRRRKVVVGSGAIAIGAAFNARVRVQFGLLPAGSKGALAELDRRTKELMDRVSDEKERREDETGSIRREIDDLRAQTARDIEALRERDRRVATHGLGWELGGLACTVFALICQAASTIVTT
jgi:multidrug efflux pump subunit AcrB